MTSLQTEIDSYRSELEKLRKENRLLLEEVIYYRSRKDAFGRDALSALSSPDPSDPLPTSASLAFKFLPSLAEEAAALLAKHVQLNSLALSVGCYGSVEATLPLAEAIATHPGLTRLTFLDPNRFRCAPVDAAAAPLLARMLRDSALLDLDLSGHHINAASLAPLVGALSEHPSLHTLGLARVPLGSGHTALSAVLASNRHLRTLSLSHAGMYSRQLASLLSAGCTASPSLETLDLSGLDFFDDAVAAPLATLLAQQTTLLSLNLSYPKRLPSQKSDPEDPLEDFSSRRPNPAVAAALADGFAKNSRLQTLGLSMWGFDDDQGARLAKALAGHPALTKLDLSRHSLGEHTVRQIGLLLQEDRPPLSVLNLSKESWMLSQRTPCFPAGTASELARGLRLNTCLKELHLEKMNFDQADAVLLAQSLAHNGTLDTLVYSGAALTSTTLVAFAEMLKVNRGLKHLDMEFSGLDGPAFRAFAGVLPTNSTLQELRIASGVELSKEELAEFETALESNTTLVDSDFNDSSDCNYDRPRGSSSRIRMALRRNQRLAKKHRHNGSPENQIGQLLDDVRW